MATPTTKPKPAATQLYMGDNGRLTCKELRCAGMTAHFNGMKTDLSGTPFVKVRPEEIEEFVEACGVEPTCESCGAAQSRLVSA